PVPAALDGDQVAVEVDLCPVECLQFAEAQTGVERGCPQGALASKEDCDQVGGFLGAGDAVAPATDGGEAELEGGVEGDLAAGLGAPVDRSHGEQGVSDCARRELLGGEPVDQILE